MKFTIAGNNAAAIGVMRELARSAEHKLVRCNLTGKLAAAVSQDRLPVTLASTIEDAILCGEAETVVVAIDDLEESLRIVRAATQSGQHVVVIPPPSCSPAYSFELHLILDESQHCIVPLLPRMALSELPLEAADLGFNDQTIRQMSIELSLAEVNAAELSASVIKGLDYLSASGFRFTQVTALDTNAPDASLLSRLITLSAATSSETPLPPGMLSIKPAIHDIQQSSLKISHADQSLSVFPIAETPAVLDRIVMATQSRELCGKWMEAFSVTLELAEAVAKSLRKRRTVDVHFDSGSEKGVFKSQMTAMGCGVLTFMIFGMVAYLIVAQLVPLPDTVLHILRILWITPLVLFLLAQALLPLARERGGSDSQAVHSQ